MNPARWRVLVIYSVWNGLMQFEWLRFAPITDRVAAQFQMTESTVGDLSLVFPLLFLPLALPMGWLIDRRSARFSLLLTAALMTLGVSLRVVAPTVGALFAGQIVLAVAQPLVIALIPKLVGVWFVEEQRLQATGLGTLSIFVGLGLAFLLVPSTAKGSIHASLWIDVAVSCMVLLATIAAVPNDPSSPTDARIDPGSIVTRQTWLADLGSLLRTRGFVVILLLSFFANGYSNALFTWLQPMLQPQGIDANHAGIAGLLMLIGGIIGMATVSRFRDIHQRLRPLMSTVMLAGIPLTFILLSTRHFGWLMAASFLIGALLLSPLPVLVDAISRISGQRLGGTAVSGFWLVGNAGAAGVIALMSWFADRQLWSIATTALAAMLLINFMIAALLLRPLRSGTIELS